VPLEHVITANGINVSASVQDVGTRTEGRLIANGQALAAPIGFVRDKRNDPDRPETSIILQPSDLRYVGSLTLLQLGSNVNYLVFNEIYTRPELELVVNFSVELRPDEAAGDPWSRAKLILPGITEYISSGPVMSKINANLAPMIARFEALPGSQWTPSSPANVHVSDVRPGWLEEGTLSIGIAPHLSIVQAKEAIRKFLDEALVGVSLDATDDAVQLTLKGPPPLPAQGIPPHFILNESGALTIAPPDRIDTTGNNLGVLRALHPQLVAISTALFEALNRHNRTYSLLLDRARTYLAQVNRPLSEVSFGTLYVEGVRLENALFATRAEITNGELPDFSAAEREPLDSLLAIHGAFVLSSATGSEALQAERNYQRRPEEDKEYKAAALDLAEELLSHPEIIEPEAAALVRNAAAEMGTGERPERSSSAGERVVINFAIAVIGTAIALTPAAVGLWLGGASILLGGAVTMNLGEAMKKAKAFTEVNELLVRGINKLSHEAAPQALSEGRRIVGPHLEFVLELAPKLRRIGTFGANQWLIRSLDWLEKQGRHLKEWKRSQSPDEPS
jgi:hypothetical protein